LDLVSRGSASKERCSGRLTWFVAGSVLIGVR
jgi:hypothetical protein